MSGSGFAYSNLFARDLPAPAARFGGYPKYNFIGGHNDPTLIPIEGLIAATTAALKKEGSKLAMYTAGQGNQGHLGMRAFVKNKAKLRSIDCSTDDILITAGSGQAIDLINAVLLEVGDTVILEEFSYGGAISKLKREGQKIVAAPLDEDGIKIDALANILKDLKGKGVTPKYIYTIPTIQNPTGSIMPLDRRQQLLKVAIEYGVPIFEDECYADLIWGGTVAPPAIYSMDRDHVIHIGSFSKTLAPALRLGYCIADWKFMSQMIACRSDSGSGALEQMVVAEYFSQHFEEHVDELSETLKGKLDTMVEALEREFGTAVEPWTPKGGIFLWMKLPEEVDIMKLVQPAAKAGIALNPGPEWACEGADSKSRLRLCFALTTKDEIRAGVAELARVCHEETGIPVRSGNVAR
jgi:2-aminoadipate transaminase